MHGRRLAATDSPNAALHSWGRYANPGTAYWSTRVLRWLSQARILPFGFAQGRRCAQDDKAVQVLRFAKDDKRRCHQSPDVAERNWTSGARMAASQRSACGANDERRTIGHAAAAQAVSATSDAAAMPATVAGGHTRESDARATPSGTRRVSHPMTGESSVAIGTCVSRETAVRFLGRLTRHTPASAPIGAPRGPMRRTNSPPAATDTRPSASVT